VPEGRLIGQPVKLHGFQRDFIHAVYDKPTRRAILSFGRKNGKTAIAAFLLLNHLCGKSFRQNSQLFSTAQSREQAAVIFQLAAKIVRMSPELRAVVQIRDTAKELLCPEKGTRYRALSAEASTAYGLSPVFVVHDELGQVRGPRSELYEALETATGA
jgi:phage terminase large subunit-like protein